MDITIIAETNENGLHPVTSQMVAAATSFGSSTTILCPGGIATDSAASADGGAATGGLGAGAGGCAGGSGTGSGGRGAAPCGLNLSVIHI